MSENRTLNIQQEEYEVQSVYAAPLPIKWLKEAEKTGNGILDAALSLSKERNDWIFIGVNMQTDFRVSDESMRRVIEIAEKTGDAPLHEALMDFARTGNSGDLWKIAHEDESRIYVRDFLNESMYRCSLPKFSDDRNSSVSSAVEEQFIQEIIPGIEDLPEEDRLYFTEELSEDFLQTEKQEQDILQDWSENIISQLAQQIPEGELRDEFIASIRKGAEKYIHAIEDMDWPTAEVDQDENEQKEPMKISISAASISTNPFNGECVAIVAVTHEDNEGNSRVGFMVGVTDAAGYISISGGVMNIASDGVCEVQENVFTPLNNRREKNESVNEIDESAYESEMSR